MRATWYVLESGEAVDPSEVSPNADGALEHKSGLVAMRSPDCPRTRGVDVGPDGKMLFGGKGDHDGNGKAGGAKAVDPVAEPTVEPVVEPVVEPAVAPAPEPIKTTDMTAAPAPAPAKNPGYHTRNNRRGR